MDAGRRCRSGQPDAPALSRASAADRAAPDRLARLAVQHLALKALVQSHPDPARLLDAWRSLQADSVTAAYAPPADPRSSEWLTAKVQAFAEEWTRELEQRCSAGMVGARQG